MPKVLIASQLHLWQSFLSLFFQPLSKNPENPKSLRELPPPSKPPVQLTPPTIFFQLVPLRGFGGYLPPFPPFPSPARAARTSHHLPPSFSSLSPFGGSGAISYRSHRSHRSHHSHPSHHSHCSHHLPPLPPPPTASTTSIKTYLIFNTLKNILSKIIKKTLKNFGGFKICYTFALCKTKTPA